MLLGHSQYLGLYKSLEQAATAYAWADQRIQQEQAKMEHYRPLPNAAAISDRSAATQQKEKSKRAIQQQKQANRNKQKEEKAQQKREKKRKYVEEKAQQKREKKRKYMEEHQKRKETKAQHKQLQQPGCIPTLS